MKNQAKGLTRIINATGYSFKGLVAAWQNEAAFRQEMCLLFVLTPLSFFLPVTPLERLAMISSLVLILIVELLNSGIEAVVDRIGPEHHELSGKAKDIASAAVFLSLCLAAFIWGTLILL